MVDKYLAKNIEEKWRKTWEKTKINNFQSVSESQIPKKFYTLVELPYTSGDLHIGHWFTFVAPDVLSRFMRMSGYNVFFPMGYDAFGLPAENAAIKHHVHPKDWTMKNIDTMTKQFQTMGTMLNWKDVVVTCLPEYYRWNQWIFLKLWEKGLAYRGKILSNWCPSCQTVLANENVENGKCWRCSYPVVQKEVEQWFLKITDYAEKLIWPHFSRLRRDSRGKPEKPTVDWPKSVRVGQNNWIGKSQGMIIKFDKGLTVFTTRPETIDGASFIVLAPEHPLVIKLATVENQQKIYDYVKRSKGKSELERKENKEKTGIFTGSYVKNPVTGKNIPVWVADYVLASYGTGAIIAVPAEDERDRDFAQKFNLSIIKTSLNARPQGEKKSIYHIRDWSVSRQRYWGTPVPMIHCPKCGVVPVLEKDLPVELPYEVDFTPKGKPPLATNEKWLEVKCWKCGGPAQRDSETLDVFFDSAWYWFRYVSPHYNKAPFNKEIAKKLTPVDVYFGGAEHTLGHTLYARFFTKFFKDLGLVDYDEFALKRVQHGIILGTDGAKMSKSKGNVINSDEAVNEYGADTVRMYLCFMMPYESTGPWSEQTIAGVNRFLNRVWKMFQNYSKLTVDDRKLKQEFEVRRLKLEKKNQTSIFKLQDPSSSFQSLSSNTNNDKKLIAKLYKTIQKVTSDIKNIKMNTAIAGMMEFMNEWESSCSTKHATLNIYDAKKFLQILAPFAPFMTEEIWRNVFEEKKSIHLSEWPRVSEKDIVEDEITIPVQVNGKVRAVLKADSSKLIAQSYVVDLALKEERVKKYLGGNKYKVIYIPGKIINLIVI